MALWCHLVSMSCCGWELWVVRGDKYFELIYGIISLRNNSVQLYILSRSRRCCPVPPQRSILPPPYHFASWLLCTKLRDVIDVHLRCMFGRLRLLSRRSIITVTSHEWFRLKSTWLFVQHLVETKKGPQKLCIILVFVLWSHHFAM